MNTIIGQITKINQSNLNRADNFEFINYLDTSNITEGRISKFQYLSRDARWPSRAKRKIKKGDIVLSTVRPNQKHFGYIKELPQNAIVSTGFAVLTPSDSVDGKYLYYFLSQEETVNLMQSIAESAVSTYPTLLPHDIANIHIDLPSKVAQESISDILSSLDDKVQLNSKMNEALEEMGQLFFRHWFIDFEFPWDFKKNKFSWDGKPYKSSGGEMINSELGEIPKEWRSSTIGQELKTILGGTPSRSRRDFWEKGTINWINSGAVNSFPITKETEKITQEALSNSAAKLMPIKSVVLPFVISPGKDVLISMLGIESCGNQSVLGIIENDELSAEFIYFWIKKIKRSIYNLASGAAQQGINKGNVEDSFMLVPDKNISQAFKDIVSPNFDEIILNSKSSNELEDIRNLLLPRLMSGKLKVQINK